MSRTLCRYTLQAITASGALFLLGCATPVEGGRTPGSEYAASQAGDEADADTQRTDKRPTRRMRTSLSMPYFSFAQSLNPRS